MSDSNLYNNQPLRTHKRLGDVINGYNTYIDNLEKHSNQFIPKKGSSPGSPTTYVPKYQYFHFQRSPSGVDTTSLGSILAESFTKYLASWAPKTTTNTTNSWITSLGNIQLTLKETEQKYVSANKQSGVNVASTDTTTNVINVLANPKDVLQLKFGGTSNAPTIDVSSIFTDNGVVPQYIDSCIANITLTTMTTSNIVPTGSYSITNKVLQSSTTPSSTTPSSTTPSSNSDSVSTRAEHRYICHDITTFFKPDISGYYQFEIGSGKNTYVVMWIGDIAVAEYTYANSTLNQTTNTIQLYADKNNFQYIRMQVFVYTPAYQDNTSPVFSLDITNAKNPILTSTGSPFYSCSDVISNNTINYLPTLLYAAFVTNSPTTYKLGEFHCYSQLNSSNKITNKELLNLYLILSVYKFNAQNGVYDTYENTTQYGQLPNGIYYTPVQNGPESKPYAFSLYRIVSDPRLGKTFQIDTQVDDTGEYEMKLLPDSFIEKSDSYAMYERYYPTPTQIANAVKTDKLKSGLPEECKTLCNASDKCNYFFNFDLNKGNAQSSMCYVDNENAKPSFNQINPSISEAQNIETGSSNLYIRNNQFSSKVQEECKLTGKDGKTLIRLEPINQTAEYGSSFPYSNYYIDSADTITDPTSIGVCVPKKKINKINNCFNKVLTTDTKYLTDGSIVGGDTSCDFTSNEGFENQEPILTDAIENTKQQGISYVQRQEREFGRTMDTISHNYHTLNKQKLPEYDAARKKLYQDGSYDMLEKNKMSFIGKAHLNVAQQNIEDNNAMYVTQNLSYILGILTILILVVLAIIM
jgi:hypothetical protein